MNRYDDSDDSEEGEVTLMNTGQRDTESGVIPSIKIDEDQEDGTDNEGDGGVGDAEQHSVLPLSLRKRRDDYEDDEAAASKRRRM